ncbi:hypothetical protein CUREI_06230 [Corynebacterium ureicelerivorans]|uniref:Uncharacterized protein n=1 Tax=Corynebacterium ureicelerivorans TaxID=401472 RepID=A0A077HL41_9CORY|nr:hypothetical protein CUREI_06230 [Corynebacterium ureicelerivorans]
MTTALVVAHRLDQAARADRILVMDAGRIIEDGTHARLIEAGREIRATVRRMEWQWSLALG